MRAVLCIAAGLLLAGTAACETNYHEKMVRAASRLPPPDTLTGALAPAPSTATDGAVATPPAPIAPPLTRRATG